MNTYPPVSPYAAGLGGKCPRCGQGKLYAGYLSLRASCAYCQLDFAKSDSGDGPAVFVIFVAGFFGVAVAFIARFVWYAPVWLAFMVSVVATAVLIGLLLRPFKATLIALQFSNKAAETRSEPPLP